jgi:hypothetical protein
VTVPTPPPTPSPPPSTPSPTKKSKVKTPKVKTPKVKTPKVKTPKVKTPKVKTPKVKTPKVKTPKVKTPKVKTPKAKTPKTKTPKEAAAAAEDVFLERNLCLDYTHVEILVANEGYRCPSGEETKADIFCCGVGDDAFECSTCGGCATGTVFLEGDNDCDNCPTCFEGGLCCKCGEGDSENVFICINADSECPTTCPPT